MYTIFEMMLTRKILDFVIILERRRRRRSRREIVVCCCIPKVQGRKRTGEKWWSSQIRPWQFRGNVQNICMGTSDDDGSGEYRLLRRLAFSAMYWTASRTWKLEWYCGAWCIH